MKQLGTELQLDNMKIRIKSEYLPREHRQITARIGGIDLEEHVENVENKKGRCAFWKYGKRRYKCRLCKKIVYLKHSVPVCEVCVKKMSE